MASGLILVCVLLFKRPERGEKGLKKMDLVKQTKSETNLALA